MAEDTYIEEENIETEIVTPGQLVMKRFLRNKLAIIGFFMILAATIFSVFGPFFINYSEYQLFYSDKNGVEVIEGTPEYANTEGLKIMIKAPPSKNHILGTDKDGRDTLTRLMYGGRISLMVGVISTAIMLIIGVTLGGLAGYYGGWVDITIMRLVDIVYSIPTLPIMLIIASLFYAFKISQEVKIYTLMLAIGLIYWTQIARIVRGQILSLRELEYMQATEAIGLSVSKRIFRHLVPNIMPQLIVAATMGIGEVILLESSLSFLGVGVDFPYSSWGNMVNAVNDPVILRNFLYIWVPPGLCILLTVLGFNLIGDGLRDAFDPKMKR